MEWKLSNPFLHFPRAPRFLPQRIAGSGYEIENLLPKFSRVAVHVKVKVHEASTWPSSGLTSTCGVFFGELIACLHTSLLLNFIITVSLISTSSQTHSLKWCILVSLCG